MSKDKAQDLKDIALVRNYVIDVVAVAVAAGTEGVTPNEATLARLEEQEQRIVEAIGRK